MSDNEEKTQEVQTPPVESAKTVDLSLIKDLGDDFWKDYPDLNRNPTTPEEVSEILSISKKWKQKKEDEPQEGTGNESGVAPQDGVEEKNTPVEDKAATKMTINEGDGNGESKEIEDPEWVIEYNKRLVEWGNAHENPWTREVKDEKTGEKHVGLKGHTKDETMKAHYTSENSMSFQGKVSKSNFGGHIQNAREEGLEVSLGSKVSPENRKAIITLCAEMGAQMDMESLTPEEKEMFESLKQPEEKVQEEVKKEVQVEDVADSTARDVEGVAAGTTPEVSQASQTRDETSQETPEQSETAVILSPKNTEVTRGNQPEGTVTVYDSNGVEIVRNNADGARAAVRAAQKPAFFPLPNGAETRMKRYAGLAQRSAGDYQGTKLDKAIAELKGKGAKIGDHNRESAALTLAEYMKVFNNPEMADRAELLRTAMKLYDREIVPDASAESGCRADYKPFSDRTPEEQAQIYKAVDKLQDSESGQKKTATRGNDAAVVVYNNDKGRN